MAEKEAKKEAAPAKAAGAEEKKAAAPAAAPKGGGGGGGGGLMSKTPVLIGGVMLLEAAVLFGGFKFLMGGGPKAASAVEVATTESSGGHGGETGGEGGGEGSAGGEKKIDHKGMVEIPVVEFRAPNRQSGRTFIYDVSIFAVAKGDNEEKLKDLIKTHEALIKDRVRTIIAQSDPEKLDGGSEPNLDTLRRQVKCQLDDVLGEGIVEEVLVPRCIPFRTDY